MINLEPFVNYEITVTDAIGAQSNAAISPAIGANERLEVIDLYVRASNANTTNVAVRIGFSAATLTAVATAPAQNTGILFSHSGMAPGTPAAAGIPGLGAKGEELRITCDDPVTGAITINYLARIRAA